MIFATGHISGGHLNPAVTLGVYLRGRVSLNDAAFYWIAQLLAGVVAALAVGLMKPALPDLAAGLNDYFQLYNYERPHQSLGYCAPADVHFAVKGPIL